MSLPLRFRWRRISAVAACLFVLSPLAGSPGLPQALAQNRLPALGDATSAELSVVSERRLGDRIMRDIRRDPAYMDDPALLAYVQSLWEPLLGASRSRGDLPAELSDHFSWEPFLVRDRSVNAFALPGGFIGVHLGLIAMTSTRDELASVLAHEMSHVTQRHIARMIGNSQRTSLIGLAGIILGILAASRSPEAANALITGGQAVTAQGQLNFSRDMEREADRVGYGVLVGAGFQSAGMAGMFEKLANASRLNDSNNFPYLRSHPLTTERIGEARARLGVGAAGNGKTKGPLEHAVMRGRARVLMDVRAEALGRIGASEAEPTPDNTAEHLTAQYAVALTATRQKDWVRADAAIKAATALAQSEPGAARQVTLLRAESLIERGEVQRAGEVLAAFAGDSSRPVRLLRARQALMNGVARTELQRSADDLQTWVALYPQDALAWDYAAQSWDKLGQPLRAVRAQAEARVAIGDLEGAVDRLRSGQRLARQNPAARDSVEASVIEARLRDVEGRRRRELIEERGDREPPPEQQQSALPPSVVVSRA